MPGQPREQDRIQCLECGKWFRALPTHLIRSHGYSDDDYRLKFGIPVGTPLVCVEWSKNQSRHNTDQGLKRTLTGRGPSPGFTQRESVRLRRRDHYARLGEIGSSLSAGRDKTVKRREMLRPYPVTVDQSAERLGCTRSAAYNFLSHCVLTGRLRRTGRGLYDEVPEP